MFWPFHDTQHQVGRLSATDLHDDETQGLLAHFVIVEIEPGESVRTDTR
jgi:hypothetical protein